MKSILQESSEIIKANNAIYANPDHMHFVVCRSPSISEEELAAIVSINSEKFINDYQLCSGGFEWSDTSAAFSVSKAEINRICQYVINQPQHHKKMNFSDEYEKFLRYYQKTIIPKSH